MAQCEYEDEYGKRCPYEALVGDFYCNSHLYEPDHSVGYGYGQGLRRERGGADDKSKEVDNVREKDE